MKTVFIHPLAGVLSAYGMGLADLRVMREKAVEASLEDKLIAPARARPRRAGRGRHGRDAPPGPAGGADRGAAQACISNTRARIRRWSSTGAPAPRWSSAFAAAHRQRYGFMMPDKRVIVEAVAVEVVGHTEFADDPVAEGRAARSPAPSPRARVTMHAEGAGHDTPVYDRDAPEARHDGSPARRSSPRRTRPPSSSPAGAPRSPRATTSCCAASSRCGAPWRSARRSTR